MELQRYPSQEDSTETALVRSIEDAFHRQHDFYIAIVTASQLKQFPVERNAIAARQQSDEEMILIWPAKLSMWNGERLQNADRTLLAQFANVQNGLTRALVLAFGSGLLLASAGTAYILCFAPDGVDSALGVSRHIESRCDLCFKLEITSCLNWCAIV